MWVSDRVETVSNDFVQVTVTLDLTNTQNNNHVLRSQIYTLLEFP